MSLLDLPIARLDGTATTLGEITDGRPALLVNVASKCGLTPQYTGLEQLHETYAERGFTVVGLPCNQFMGQEPGSPEEATRRWTAMRGRSGVLRTGHCLRDTASGAERSVTASTTVHFASPSDEEVAAYVDRGEPLHVAGAFTVDGLGGAFVRGIEGDHHNVVGVSLPVLREMVGELGHRWTDLWAPRA